MKFKAERESRTAELWKERVLMSVHGFRQLTSARRSAGSPKRLACMHVLRHLSRVRCFPNPDVTPGLTATTTYNRMRLRRDGNRRREEKQRRV